MSHKEILQVIQREGLKEISGTSPLACLNAMLHTNSRGEEGIFYKVPGRMGVYTLKKDVPDEMKDLSEMWDDSSDGQSDSQSTESNEKRERKKISSRLSQPASPQSSCPSPSIAQSKVMSPSQKHSKKALKQALKQQQQRKQCRPGLTVSSNPRLLLKSVKATDQGGPKIGWEMKQSDGRSQNSTCSSSASGKMDQTLSGLGRKPSQRSERLNARQLKRTKAMDIDVETPDSILVNTNLRALINKHTFSVFPGEFQQRLLLLLPEVDRQMGTDGFMRLSTSALNNEFFTSAAQGWKERLSEGEFTPEMQLRIRQEIEKEKKVEQWKESFFENYYGQNSGISLEDSEKLTASTNNIEDCQYPASKQAPVQLATLDTSSKARTQIEAKGVKDNKTGTKEVRTLKGEEKAVKTEKSTASSEECKNNAPIIKNLEEKSSGISTLPEKNVDHVQSPSLLKQDNQATGPRPVTSPKPKVVVVKPEPNQTESKRQLRSERSDVSDSKKPETIESVENKPRELSKQDQLVKVASAEEMEVTAEGLKRKSNDDRESVLSPEKRPRVVDHPLFRNPPEDFPRNKIEPQEPNVSPLKIPVSRTRAVQIPIGQVSPRATFPLFFTSPGRTSARTLADIKAKAQLARALHAAAAAAAAAGAAVPGPGPGGGIEGGGGTGAGTGSKRTSGQGSTLDQDRTGGRRGLGGPLSICPGEQSKPRAEATIEAGASVDTRTQLQPAATARCKSAICDVDSNKFTASALTSPSAHKAVSVAVQTPLQTPTATTNVTANKTSPSPMQTHTVKQTSSPTMRNVLKLAPVVKDSEYAKAAIQSSENVAVHNKSGEGGNQQPSVDSNDRASNVDRKLPADTQLPSLSLDAKRNLQVASSASTFATAGSCTSVATGGTTGTLKVAPPVSEANVESCVITSTASTPLFCTSQIAASLKTQVPVREIMPKSSLSIPANNPLVTQLLQGKQLPLEQFLPKALTKVEMKPVYQFSETALNDKVKISSDGTVLVSVAVRGATTVIHRSGEVAADLIKGRQTQTIVDQGVESIAQRRLEEQFEQTSKNSSTSEEQQSRDSDQDCIQSELFNRSHDRIPLPTLSSVQSQSLAPLSESLQYKFSSSGFPSEDASVGPRSRFGLMGTKSALKPAVSGHYLLNTATYGRGSESWKRAHGQSTVARVAINGQLETPEKQLKEGQAKAADAGIQQASESISRSESCHPSVVIKTEQDASQAGDGVACPQAAYISSGFVKQEALVHEHRHTGKENTPLLLLAQVAGVPVSKEYHQGIQSHLAHAGGSKLLQSHQDPNKTPSLSVGFQQPAQHQQRFPAYGNRASSQFAFRPVHSGNNNVPSVSPANHCSAVKGLSVYSQVSNSSGNMVSFSVTVTTLPAGPSINTNTHGQSAQTFSESGNMEDSPSKCYCRLKAMIMCKGCGAFCHDDCIGPSKLCVSCLVVR
ncbi:putative Polycomb group protein ASXL2 isoform X3 [Amblyraja radiata]|nr:putative Polycomb group protein ASXL2 isoform X3 [Amblyraja radiata]